MQTLQSDPVSTGPTPTNFFGAAAPPAERTVVKLSNFSSQNVIDFVNANGNHEIKNIRIFKMGTFKDSMGFQNTWEDIHLEQMVMHYTLLKDGGIFPNVPVREDHSFSVTRVVGYLTDVYRDPSDPAFLACSFEFTEPDAYDKWKRGTYRSRSLEVGMYETNDGASFWPVVMGWAFVDIPAVEGLHGKGDASTTSFSQVTTDNKETSVPPDINTDPEGWLAAANYAKALQDWSTAATYAQACVDWERAVTYAAAVEAQFQQTPPVPPVPGTPPVVTPPVQQSFRVNGAELSDYARVQAHIDTLEQFRSDTITSGRTDFVTGLAESGRIAATQVDSMTALALSMNTEQFDAFRQTYESAPPSPLFQPHGQQNGENNNPDDPQRASSFAGGTSTDLSEIEQLEDIIQTHKNAGMSQEKIEKTSSWAKLQALKATTK